MHAGNFLGTSNGNNNQTDLAAYFPGAGTYIWSQAGGFMKIDGGVGAGMAAVELTGGPQSQLLEYFPGSGMYEWQNGVGWSQVRQHLGAADERAAGDVCDRQFPGRRGCGRDRHLQRPGRHLARSAGGGYVLRFERTE